MFKTRKERLFEDLLAANEARIYRICHSYLGSHDEVSDLYQEILIQIWNAIDRFRQDSSWETYIYRIAVNTAIKFKSKNKNKNAALPIDKVDSGIVNDKTTEPDTEAAAELELKESRLNAMHQCIQLLSDADKLLITLVLEDLSYSDIAKILDSNTNLVGVRINRIKKRISKLMEKHFGSL